MQATEARIDVAALKHLRASYDALRAREMDVHGGYVMYAGRCGEELNNLMMSIEVFLRSYRPIVAETIDGPTPVPSRRS
jgi:hypothetical protein